MALSGAAKQSVLIQADFQDKASSGLRTLSGTMNETLGDQASGGMGKLLGKVKLSWAAVGVAAAAAGTAIVAGIGKSIGVAADFQQAMADVGAITRASAGDMAKLEEKAKEMGRTTSFSASQSAEAIQFLGMAGFDTNEILTALPDTLTLASAGGLELGKAADIASNVLSGMRMETSELGTVVDGMALTAASANTSVEQLGSAMSFAAPGAAAAGVSFSTASAALGIMADNGIQAERGGTSFNAMLRVMQTNTDENSAALREMGIEFMDSSGKLKPLADNIEAIEKAGLSSAQMISFFGDEGSRAINAMVGSGSRKLRELTREIENSGGAAEEMAKKKMNTFQGAWKTTQSAVEGLMITIGEKFLPLMQRTLADYITPAVQAFGDWMDRIGGLGEMFSDALRLVTEFGRSIWTTIDSIFSDTSFRETFLANLVDGFVRTFSSIKDVAIMWLAGLFGPNGIFATAALVVWEPLKFAFGLIWEPIKSLAVQGWNAVSEVVVEGINFLIDKVNSVGEHFGLTISNIDFTPLTVDAPETVEARWATMKKKTDENWEALEQSASDLGTSMSESFSKVGDEIVATYDTVVAPNLSEGFKETARKYTEEAAKPIEVKTAETAAVVVKEMNEAGKKTTADAKSHGKKTGEGFADGVESEIKTIPGIFEETLGGISFRSSFRDVSDNLGDALGKRIGAGMSAGMGSSVKDIVGQGVSILQDAQARGWGAEHTGAMIGGGLGAGVGGFFGGPQGAVLGAKVGSFLGGKIGGLFGSDDSGERDRALVGRVILAGRGRGGGTTENFHRPGSRKAVEAALSDLGFTRAAGGGLHEISGAIRSGRIYGEEGQKINRLIYKWAYEQAWETHQRKEAEAKFNAKVAEAVQWSIDRRSAAGYQGVVNSPTMFLAGEAGPEMVSVTPRGASFQGGGWGGGQGATLNFNFELHAIDSRSVKQFIEEDAREVIVEMLNKESFRSASVVYQTGVTTDPSV